jgi:hypothetical protein
MTCEVPGLVGVLRRRLEHGDDPEGRAQLARPRDGGDQQRLGIADTVDGDDDVGCPGGLGRVLTDDDDRAGCARDKRRTDGVDEPCCD